MKPPNAPAPFVMRGESMTRIETFVAAAFAFAVTMLVISVGTIPNNFNEFLSACKQIPAFAASFAMITWIWRTHALWSRRYGLENGMTIFLSSTLIFLVLIYVYPLRVLMESLFASLTNDFFPSSMQFEREWQIRFMFGFYAVGFLLLCLNFTALFLYAKKQQVKLSLTEQELYITDSDIISWVTTACICLLSLMLSIFLPLNHLSWAGYVYFLLFPLLTAVGFWRHKKLVESMCG